MSVQPAPLTNSKLPQSNEEWDRFFELDPGSEADTTALVNAALAGLTKRIECLASGSRAELRHVLKLLVLPSHFILTTAGSFDQPSQ